MILQVNGSINYYGRFGTCFLGTLNVKFDQDRSLYQLLFCFRPGSSQKNSRLLIYNHNRELLVYWHKNAKLDESQIQILSLWSAITKQTREFIKEYMLTKLRWNEIEWGSYFVVMDQSLTASDKLEKALKHYQQKIYLPL